jgi:hypothetical protein
VESRGLARSLTRMKLLAMTVVMLGAIAGGARADAPRHSMKGWELYTWFDLACSASAQTHSAPNPDSWCVSLQLGTNRLKSAAEIQRAPMKWHDLAAALATLRRGEDVVWISTPNTFTLPTAPLRDRIVARARAGGLNLAFAERK